MINHRILKSLGLTKHEAEVYITLVELGPSIISHIVKQTGLHRPTIYRTLIPLQRKELISVIVKGKQKLYTAEPPDKLATVFESLKGDFEKILPDLQRIYERKKKQTLVKFLEGKNGIQFILNDLVHTLKRGEVYYRYSSKRAALALEKYIPRGLRKRRDAKQLQRYMITDAAAEWQEKQTLNRAHKLLPSSSHLFNDNTAELIYAGKTAFIDFDSETAVLIENPTTAEFQKKLFKALYNLL